jgi:DNA repair photolyase
VDDQSIPGLHPRLLSYCFARPTHTYLDFNAREDFERQIVVKVNVPELLRAELARPRWKGEHVALGTNTDPYQWVEGRYKLMPGIWEAMRDFSNPCSILTKSPLLLRDIEVMKELVERTEFSAALSIPTIDEKAWRQTEPHTPHPRKRMEAVGELSRAGIPTSILIGPIIPGVNDSPEQIGEILELAGEAGAANVIGIPLHLRGEVKEIWFDWLREYRPDLIPHYEELYERGAYMKKAESERLSGMVSYARRTPAPRHRGTRKPPERPAQPEPAAADQASLF